MMNTRIWMGIALLSGLVFASGCGGAAGGGAQTGSVAGVIAAGSGIQGPVQVGIRGTSLETEACSRGTYSLTGVPAGDRTLALMIDGTALEFPVQVVAGETTQLDLAANGVWSAVDEPTGPLTASIDAGATWGVAPLEVPLVPRVEGGQEPYTYFWDFNGVATSTVPAPCAHCVEPGKRTIRLRVTDSNGDVATASVEITVDPPLRLSLTPSTTESLDVGDDLTFTTELQGCPQVGGDAVDLEELHYYYYFGDGTMAHGRGLTEVTHTYWSPVAGDCAVFVYGGEDQFIWLGAATKVHVAGEPAPEPQTPGCVASVEVSFAELLTDSCLQLTEDFALRGIAGETTFEPSIGLSDVTGLDRREQLKVIVDWGDGIRTEDGVAHTYDEAGTYEAALWASVGEFEVYSRAVLVEIDEPFRITHVDWPSEDDESQTPNTSSAGPEKNRPQGWLCPHKTYEANVETKGGKAPVAYFWDFGDGTESRKKNPRHQYTAPGWYLIRIVVIDEEGWLRRKSWQVNVRKKLQLLGLAWATSSRTEATNTALKAKIRGGCPKVRVIYRFAGEPRETQLATGPGLRRTFIPGLDYTVQVQAVDGHGHETPWKTYTVTAPTGR